MFTDLLCKNSKMTMSMKLFDLDLLMVLLSCKDLLSFCSLLTRLKFYLLKPQQIALLLPFLGPTIVHCGHVHDMDLVQTEFAWNSNCVNLNYIKALNVENG